MSMSMSRAIEELVEGHKCASKLHHLLLHHDHDDASSAHQDLVLKVLTSFSHTLSVLVPDSSSSHSTNNSTTTTTSRIIHHHHHDCSPAAARKQHLKDKRGCYKRKRSGPIRTVASPYPAIDDGHSWRKYGQKEILNSKHPRSYFRCTKKYDQGCAATKQVQKMEDNPQMYQITYIGHHTCKDMMTPQIIPDDDILEPHPQEDSVMWKDWMMAGFNDSSKTNNPIVEMMDHHRLNNVLPLIKSSPSVDNFDSEFPFEETDFHLGL